MRDFYGPQLARIHAEGFAPKLAPAFPWLLAQIQSVAAKAQLWDLGCGDGLWLGFAQSAGLHVEGVDRSRAFVELCHCKGLAVRCTDAAQAQMPKGTTAVTALGEVLCYEPAALVPVTKHLAQQLPVGGGFWFDLIGPEVRPSLGRYVERDWCIESEVEISGDSLCRRITIESEHGIHTELHRQQIFQPHEVLDLLGQHGFVAHMRKSYGDLALLPGRFAVAARLAV